MSSGPRPARRPADLLAVAMGRSFKLGRKANKVSVERDLAVPMQDGTILLADHYAPVMAQPRPTVLMRCPYGRGWQFALLGRPFAERGYHVLLQSTRGTFGSGGMFTPGTNEAADGQDTVAWLRKQGWFSGQLALVGASYLAYAAWALAADPPPELTAMAVYISPHDLAAAGFGQGPFELYNLLMWSDLMAHQESLGAARMMWRTMNADARLAPALGRLPLAATGAEIARAGAPWYADWLAHRDSSDDYYAGYRATPALEQVTVPTLLISGFHDFFVEQTVREYRALRRRGVQTALTIGPWTHLTFDMGLAIRETVAWLDAFADGNEDARSPRPSRVRVWTSGREQWQMMPDWPPAGAAERAWYFQPGGNLAMMRPEAPAARAAMAATAFRYDPADPTPSAGGRLMSLRSGGSQDNTALEARPDVLTFSSRVLDAPVEVAGVPAVEVYLSSDNPYCDIFARLCDVDPQDRSRNLTDQIVRCAPEEVTPGEVRRLRIELTDVSHVFLPGHRIRVQVSGGAHPRFARNLGTGGDLLTGIETAPVRHLVQHNARYPSALILPVRQQPAGRGADAARSGRAL